MIAVMAAFCLTIHARYQCRHAGACCQNWTVQAEPRVVQLVAQRGLRRSGVNGPLFVSSINPDLPGSMEVSRDKNGSCVFFEQDAGRLCVIHRDAGVEALPSACRHFPRKFLRDGRGTFVSLSHFCPTAALLLLGEHPLRVTEAEPPLMLDEPVEGLDAREALPPLLRPGVLCDLESYDAWERASIAMLGRKDLTWQAALDRIAAATERVRTWRPGTTSLAQHVGSAFAAESDRIPHHGSRIPDPDLVNAPRLTQEQLVTLVWQLTQGRVPNDIHPIDAFEDRWRERVGHTFERYDAVMKNFVAARLFANWIAYQGRGLRSVVQWGRAAAALVRHQTLRRALDSGRTPGPDDVIEAIRMADLILLHVIDTQAFARAAAPLESIGPA
jgi:Fe-S-cluster containining protein